MKCKVCGHPILMIRGQLRHDAVALYRAGMGDGNGRWTPHKAQRAGE